MLLKYNIINFHYFTSIFFHLFDAWASYIYSIFYGKIANS